MHDTAVSLHIDGWAFRRFDQSAISPPNANLVCLAFLLFIHHDYPAGSFCFSTCPILRLHRSADVYYDRRLILRPSMCFLLVISYHSFSSSLSPSSLSTIIITTSFLRIWENLLNSVHQQVPLNPLAAS